MDYLFYLYRRRSTLIYIIKITMMGIAYVILVAMKKNTSWVSDSSLEIMDFVWLYRFILQFFSKGAVTRKK